MVTSYSLARRAGPVCESPAFRVSFPQVRPQAQGTSFTLSCLGLLIGPHSPPGHTQAPAPLFI